jgi:hypothetical protein
MYRGFQRDSHLLQRSGRRVSMRSVRCAQAEAGPLAAAELAGEAVSPIEFMGEVTALLSEATQRQAALGQELAAADAKLAEIRVGGWKWLGLQL